MFVLVIYNPFFKEDLRTKPLSDCWDVFVLPVLSDAQWWILYEHVNVKKSILPMKDFM